MLKFGINILWMVCELPLLCPICFVLSGPVLATLSALLKVRLTSVLPACVLLMALAQMGFSWGRGELTAAPARLGWGSEGGFHTGQHLRGRYLGWVLTGDPSLFIQQRPASAGEKRAVLGAR